MEGAAAAGKAIWAFESTGAGQISISKDQALHVLAQDNPEWWYVRTDAGEGYIPASYVQIEAVGDENASDAGSVASASAASAQSSAGSSASAGSLSRFMKSPHGQKKKQHAMQEVRTVRQLEQTPGIAEAPAAVTASVGGSSEDSVELQLLKEAHAQSLAKVMAETEQQRAAHEAQVLRLRASLTQTEEQHALDQLELKATRSALTVAEDALAATKEANEHLKAAATEHALTEKRMRAEIESLRSQLDRSRDEAVSLRRANAAVGTNPSLDKATTAAQTEWERDGATGPTAVTSIDGSRTVRPQSAPADRTMVAQPRWTALDASATEPAKSGQESGDQAPSSFSRSGTVSRQRRRGRAARQTNMRPQSAPARHSVALSATMLPGNRPDLLAVKAQRRRHYSKPPPNGGKVAGVGLGAAAAAATKQRQSSHSTAKQAYALMNAASEFSSLAGVSSEGSLHRGGQGFELSALSALDSSGDTAAIRRTSAESTASAKQLQEFEDRVASLLKAPGSRQRPPAPPQPAAVWARLQKVG